MNDSDHRDLNNSRRQFAPDQRVKVALVGAGGWGWQHARVFGAHRDVDVCAVFGRTSERTEARAREFGIPRAYTNLAEMLEREQPDLVAVSLPNQDHFAATMQIIEAGFPLLVEKPLVFDLAEADALLDAANRRDLFFAINFNHRYAVPVRNAKSAIVQGDLGPIVFATWRFGGEGGSGGQPHANLIETQCHGFDMLEHLCGPIETIQAQMTAKTGDGFRTVALALGFESKAIGTMLGSYDASYAYPGTHRVEISGTDAHVVIEDTVRRYTFQRRGDETRHVWEAGYFNDRDREFHRTFDAHADALIAAFRAGGSPPIPATAGRRALQLAYAAIRSFETGTRVAVADVARANDS